MAKPQGGTGPKLPGRPSLGAGQGINVGRLRGAGGEIQSYLVVGSLDLHPRCWVCAEGSREGHVLIHQQRAESTFFFPFVAHANRRLSCLTRECVMRLPPTIPAIEKPSTRSAEPTRPPKRSRHAGEHRQ